MSEDLVFAAGDHGIYQILEDEADRADRVVVARDRELDEGRVGVGIDEGDDRDVQAAGFGHGDGFAGGVDDDHSVRLLVHVAHTAEVAEELFALAAEGGEFLFRHGLEFRLLLDVFEILEALDRLADGEAVGEHAAQPAMVDVVLAGRFCGFADGILGLALAADEEDFLALADEVGEEIGGFIELLDGFFQVDDVDSAFVLHEEGLHARIPFLGLVPVVDAGVHPFVDEFVCSVFPALNQDGRFLKICRMESLRIFVGE